MPFHLSLFPSPLSSLARPSLTPSFSETKLNLAAGDSGLSTIPCGMDERTNRDIAEIESTKIYVTIRLFTTLERRMTEESNSREWQCKKRILNSKKLFSFLQLRCLSLLDFSLTVFFISACLLPFKRF